MTRNLYVPVAAGLVVVGVVLNAVMLLPAAVGLQLNLHFAAVLAGQLCWGAAMFVFLMRGNIYASEKLSYDGPAFPIFNTVKWGLVAAFLFCDAFLLERIWEWYFILR
jgi:hypothetical protein